MVSQVLSLYPVLVVLLAVGVKSEDCSFEHLDELGAHIFLLGVEDRPIPTTEEGVKDFCQKSETAVAEIKDFANKCLAPFPKQLAMVMLNSAYQEVQSWCSEERMEEYIRHAKCMHDSQEQIDECMRGLVMHLSDISVGAPVDDRIPLACCNFALFEQCSLRAAKENCDEDTEAFLDQVLKSYTGETMALACASFQPGSAACSALSMPEHDDAVPTPKTALQPLIKMLADMASKK